jgi:hypothetical protein
MAADPAVREYPNEKFRAQAPALQQAQPRLPQASIVLAKTAHESLPPYYCKSLAVPALR